MKRKGNVRKQFCSYWEERSAVSAARKAIDAMIPEISKSTLPINLESAARYVGIEHVVDADMTGTDGLLSSTRSGAYVVSLRKGQSRSRRRFTLAHEMGHAIVCSSIARGDRAKVIGPLDCRTETEDDKDEERLCDLIAAELLMPVAQFSQAMDEIGVCARTIPTIARQFGVSLQASCWRIMQILPYEINMGLWKMDESESRFVPEWYLAKSGVRMMNYSIVVGQPGSACFGDEPFRGWHWIRLFGQMDKYYVDVCPISSIRKVWLVLFVFDRAAHHIVSKISRGRSRSTAQLTFLE